ncbi:MAG TPA: ribbon-helix-helix protein, CopG family [Vicinamibacterales bacterium]|nr:ribbon-helix-helix protein, CopG family [Vicinamibacterales bacterium]
MAKLTFSLDEETVAKLRKTAARLRKPQSMVVREAIARYAAEEDKLSDEERARLLEVIDRFMKLPPSGSHKDAEREIREIRRSRRIGWHPGAK